MGFGTGINTFMTYLYALKNNRTVNYYATDKEPFSIKLVNQLDYVDFLGSVY